MTSPWIQKSSPFVLASMWSYHHCIIISNLDFMILKFVERFDSCLVFKSQPLPGAMNSASGIVSMLEVVESDFGRSLAEAESIETSRVEEHDSMSKQNKLTEVQKAADQKFKTKTSSDLDQAVMDLAADSETAKEELAAVLTYQESLAKQCFDGGMSYEERKAQREEEIKGLKEALAALGEGGVLLQGQLRGALVKPHRP